MMNKKAAMEMSVGTIVTIVLLMSVMVLGIFLVQKIFKSSSNAIDAVTGQLDSQIDKMFGDDTDDIVIYPATSSIKVDLGSNSGFLFSVRNTDTETAKFTYTVEPSESFVYSKKCGSAMTKQKATDYLDETGGSFDLTANAHKKPAEIVRFSTQKDDPACTIPYILKIQKNGVPFRSTKIYITFN